MKLLVVLLALFAASSFGQSSQTLCAKYTAATGYNASTLVSGAVSGTFTQVLATPILAQFFNGTTPAGSTNFLLPANSAAYTAFFNQVVYFFESALGCNDSSTVAYTGPSMTTAHAGLGINYAEFNAFNTIVGNVLFGAGFSAADAGSVATILGTLGNGVICTASDCSNICNRYSVPYNLNNTALISLVVQTTVTNVLATPLAQFFNGTTPPGSTNFLTNTGAFNTLFAHLVQFFGSALGCTDGSIGAYAGQTLQAAHAGMGITVAQFNQFNNILLAVLANLQVSQADLTTISGVLNGTQSMIVSGGSSSGSSGSGSSGASGSGSSGASGSGSSGASGSGSSGKSGSSGASGSGSSGASGSGSSGKSSSSSSSSSSTGSAITLYVAMIALLLSILI